METYYELLDGNRRCIADGFSLDEVRAYIERKAEDNLIRKPGYVHADYSPLPVAEQEAFIESINAEWASYHDSDAKYDAQVCESAYSNHHAGA